MIFTWPNILTMSRIILTPIIVRYLILGQWGIASIIFALAALTDIFDGALARWSNQQTTWGALLDPLADKILFVTCYVTLFFKHVSSGIPLWFVCVILMREFLLIIGSLFLHYVVWNRGAAVRHIIIYPSFMGKLTTVGHCLILIIVYVSLAGFLNINYTIFKIVIYFTAFCTIFSAAQYAAAWKRLMELT